MIEETGRVVEIQDDFAWVETEPATGCGSCAARNGCGTSVLAKVMGRRKAPLRVANRIGAVAGDRVVVGIPESGLVRGSLAVYMVPLAGLFAGALAGQYVGDGLAPGHADLTSIPGAIIGFAASLAWLKRFSRVAEQDERYQPVLLRQLTATNR